MESPITVEWCPRPGCSRPFLSRSFRQPRSTRDAGRVACPHCGATMNRNPDYTYGSAPMLPEEEEKCVAEHPARERFALYRIRPDMRMRISGS